MDGRALMVGVALAVLAVLYQNGVVDKFVKDAQVFLIQNYWFAWFVLPALVAGFLLLRRNVIPTNQILSPDNALKNALNEKSDEFLKRQHARIKQFYRDHPRLPYFVWDASKPNALGVRTFLVKSARLHKLHNVPVTYSVGYFIQQAPSPAGSRVAFIGSPYALLNILGAQNIGHALTQSVGYSADQKALEQFERIALESGDETLKAMYGQVAANSAARSLLPTHPQGAK